MQLSQIPYASPLPTDPARVLAGAEIAQGVRQLISNDGERLVIGLSSDNASVEWISGYSKSTASGTLLTATTDQARALLFETLIQAGPLSCSALNNLTANLISEGLSQKTVDFTPFEQRLATTAEALPDQRYSLTAINLKEIPAIFRLELLEVAEKYRDRLGVNAILEIPGFCRDLAFSEAFHDPSKASRLKNFNWTSPTDQHLLIREVAEGRIPCGKALEYLLEHSAESIPTQLLPEFRVEFERGVFTLIARENRWEILGHGWEVSDYFFDGQIIHRLADSFKHLDGACGNLLLDYIEDSSPSLECPLPSLKAFSKEERDVVIQSALDRGNISWIKTQLNNSLAGLDADVLLKVARAGLIQEAACTGEWIKVERSKQLEMVSLYLSSAQDLSRFPWNNFDRDVLEACRAQEPMISAYLDGAHAKRDRDRYIELELHKLRGDKRALALAYLENGMEGLVPELLKMTQGVKYLEPAVDVSDPLWNTVAVRWAPFLGGEALLPTLSHFTGLDDHTFAQIVRECAKSWYSKV